METFQKFLDAIATKGGNLLTLSVFVAGLGVLVYHVLHHHEESQQIVTVLLTTFSAFSGALLAALQGRDRQINGPAAPGSAANAPTTASGSTETVK